MASPFTACMPRIGKDRKRGQKQTMMPSRSAVRRALRAHEENNRAEAVSQAELCVAFVGVGL